MQPATKKKLLVGILILAGGLLIGSVVAYLLYLGQFARYQDREYGFSIKYPRAWEMVVHPSPGAPVVFRSPKENALDVFQENVNVTVQDVAPDIATIKSFSDRILFQMGKVFKNAKLVESKEINVGFRKGLRVKFVEEQPEAVTILIAWTIKGGDKAYVLTYLAKSNRYKKYLPLVEGMFKSFELK